MVKAIQRKSVSNTSSVLEGKVRKAHDHEQVEIQMYLSKLRELVPNMPKDRKVSKVEVINNVIDYICDLQTALLDQLHQHPASINNNNLAVVNGNSCALPIVMETSSSADCPTYTRTVMYI
ncbi:extra macrochaetae-like protein [Daphnia sinensis]|uniref:Extra macrochaetae-like protein n=1 Tax=Daphnia sinensis TaxID=1820382 RepID=A0AAD5KQA0_9CRUS|nr:extra macrochaetae-like protein [Daphnia sinensis]